MHVLILEAGLTGHHANYLERIASTFLAQGHRLTVCVRQEYSDHPLFARVRAQHLGRVDVKVIQPLPSWTQVLGRLGVVGSELSHWLMFKRSFEQVSITDRVDQVFFPYLDYCLHAIALLGSFSIQVPWAGICMRPSFHHAKIGVLTPPPKWGSIKERLFFRLLQQPGLKSIYTIDELLVPYVSKLHQELAPRLQYLPDPAELPHKYSQATARVRLNLAAEEFLIVVYGAIDERKGIDLLLNAVREHHFSRPLRILVAGRHTPALRSQLSGNPLITSIDQYVDHDVEEAVFRAADAVWMGYRSHFSMSGVLVLAAMANKPVIATHNGLIGWFTKKYCAGLAIDCENPKIVANTIQLLAETDTPYTGQCLEVIRSTHSWHRFTTIIGNGSDNTHILQ